MNHLLLLMASSCCPTILPYTIVKWSIYVAKITRWKDLVKGFVWKTAHGVIEIRIVKVSKKCPSFCFFCCTNVLEYFVNWFPTILCNFNYVVISCQKPEARLGSYVVVDYLTVNSVAEYGCELGHVMEGKSNRTCQHDGKWSGDIPRCRCTYNVFFCICNVICLPSSSDD